MLKILAVLVLILLVGVWGLVRVGSFGSRPVASDHERFKVSQNFNPAKKVFFNRQQALMDEMRKKGFSFKLMREWFSARPEGAPSQPLPQVKPNFSEFVLEDGQSKLIWFGHSTFLMKVNGLNILIDPVFGPSAAPYSFMVKRFQAPVIGMADLPEIDFVVISHDHYDHLDKTSIDFFKNKKTLFITPLGVGVHLKGWGIGPERIVERDWWESYEERGVSFTATPAQHFSGRDGFNNNETLWASWVIKSKESNIFFSGDSGYDIHFKEIGERLGPFDIALMETGQYDSRWRPVHMFPEDAVKAFKELGASAFFPIHWGMFELAFHPWFEPAEKVLKLASSEKFKLITPKMGEVVSVGSSKEYSPWWRGLMPKN